MVRYLDWPAGAVALVERACERHGGWSRYERLRTVSGNVVFLRGPIPSFMGMNRRYPAFGRVRVEPREQRTTFVDWPSRGSDAEFAHGNVRLSSTESPAHRRHLPALRWSPIDAAYFFGYALANYFALPFLLSRTRFVSASQRRVVVDFPPGLDAHCTRQAFEFDENGLLVAHDYTADVLSRVARGRHYTSDYVEAGGMMFAQSRRVVARIGAYATPFTVLEARLEGLAAS
jgi:hypothetical protein